LEIVVASRLYGIIIALKKSSFKAAYQRMALEGVVSETAIAGAAFDRIAQQYDELWTCSPVGRLQRKAVWRRLDILFEGADFLLDLGCGTGEDALHFMRNGISVRAFDASSGMVRIARGRNVDASVLGTEELHRVQGYFDGVISNFGACASCTSLDGRWRG